MEMGSPISPINTPQAPIKRTTTAKILRSMTRYPTFFPPPIITGDFHFDRPDG
jgi:hypothetical protein